MSQVGSSSETQIRGVDLRMNRLTLSLLLLVITMTLTSCSAIRTTFSVIKTTYKTIKGTIKGTVWVVRGTYQLTKETTRLVYHIGMFTFEVVRAPLDYPLTRDDLQTIDGLPPKEAIRQGQVKNAPYTVYRQGPSLCPDDGRQRTDLRRNGLGVLVWGRNQEAI